MADLITPTPILVRKFWIVRSPVALSWIVTDLAGFCAEHSLHKQSIERVARGERKHHKGWIAEEFYSKFGIIPIRNQIQEYDTDSKDPTW